MAADVVVVADDCWPPEDIDHDATLYYRVHRNDIRFAPPNDISPGLFRRRGEGMSTEWSRYATAEEAQNRRGKGAECGILRLVVRQVRAIPHVSVTHTPWCRGDRAEWFRSHTDVTIDGSTEKEQDARWNNARLMLKQIARWEIRVPVKPAG